MIKLTDEERAEKSGNEEEHTMDTKTPSQPPTADGAKPSISPQATPRGFLMAISLLLDPVIIVLAAADITVGGIYPVGLLLMPFSSVTGYELLGISGLVALVIAPLLYYYVSRSSLRRKVGILIVVIVLGVLTAGILAWTMISYALMMAD
jgi:hypothetical protein